MSALIWCPFPDRATATSIADTLLDQGVIACANILGDMHSRYEWNGERGTDDEVAVLFKTHSDCLETAVARIESLHPYETPAILGWRCDVANAAAEAWLGGIEAKAGAT